MFIHKQRKTSKTLPRLSNNSHNFSVEVSYYVHVACVGSKIPERKEADDWPRALVDIPTAALEAQTTECLPLLVFEVLERQIYDLLDQAIQQRVQRDLGRHSVNIFIWNQTVLCQNDISVVKLNNWIQAVTVAIYSWVVPVLKLQWAQEKRWSLLPNPSALISSPFVAHHYTRHKEKQVILFVNVICDWFHF